MAPGSARFCSQCGAPLQESQRFCTNCGATNEAYASSPTIAASQTPATPSASETAPASSSPQAPADGSVYNYQSLVPPPPPPPIYNPYTSSPSGSAPSYAQATVPDSPAPITPTAPPGTYQVPAYAQKPQGRRGCVTGSIVLLLVLVLGIGGYFLLHALESKNTGGNPATSGSTATVGTGSGSTATSTRNTPTSVTSSAKIEQLNLQVTYAGVGITLTSAQLASSFPDDTSTTPGSAGVVRVTLRENNTTTSNPDYVESEVMLLLLPGGTTTQPGNVQNGVSPSQGVNRLNWVDFPLNAQVALNQLTLRIGAQGDSQIDVPLQPQADLSKYQDKTSNPNAQFKYGLLTMTIKTATLSYSYADKQASAGNRYVLLTLSAANTSANNIDVYPPSEMRLQAGGNSLPPDNTYTLPYTVNASTSASGIVAFLVPQNTTTFTLVMLAQPDASPAISQATQSFQIQ